MRYKTITTNQNTTHVYIFGERDLMPMMQEMAEMIQGATLPKGTATIAHEEGEIALFIQEPPGEFTGRSVPVKIAEPSAVASARMGAGNARPERSEAAESPHSEQIDKLAYFLVGLDCNYPRSDAKYPTGMTAVEAAQEYILELRENTHRLKSNLADIRKALGCSYANQTETMKRIAGLWKELVDRRNDVQQGATQLEQTRRIAATRGETLNQLLEDVEILEQALKLIRKGAGVGNSLVALRQLRRGPVKDGDLASKTGRDDLIRDELASKKGEWNFITGKGIFVIEKLEEANQ